MTRRFTLIIGLVLALGAFLGLVFLGAVVNPSPYPVVVIIKDVEPGEILGEGMWDVDPQMISPQVAEQYILRPQLDDYLGKVVSRRLYPGQPLMHYDVIYEGNVMAYRRLALALEDPDQAAMVLPVDEGDMVDAVMPGDWVAILWSIGDESSIEQMGGLFGEPEAPPPEYGLPEYVVGPGGELVPVATEEVSGEEGEGEDAEVESTPTPRPTATPVTPAEVEEALEGPPVPGAELVPEVSLPLAKRIVNAAQVIGVQREKEHNPAYTGEPGEEPFLEGKVIGLELVVHLDELEVIRFIIANGEYSLAVLSPNADIEAWAEASSTTVMWRDVKSYIMADRMRALGVYSTTETIRPMGAADVYEDVLNPHLVEETPRPVIPVGQLTPTPRADEEDAGEEAVSTPGPLPTATPVSEVAEATEQPAATPQATSAPSGEQSGLGGMGLTMNNLLVGAGCVVAVLGVLVLVIIVVSRRLKKK